MDKNDEPVQPNNPDLHYIVKSLDNHIPEGWKLKIKHNLQVNDNDIDKAIDSNHKKSLTTLIDRNNLSVDHLHKIFDGSNSEIKKYALLHSKNINSNHIDKAIQDNDISVQEAAAGHENISTDLLYHIIRDKTHYYGSVKTNAIKNPSMTENHLLEVLKTSNHINDYSSVALHPKATEKVLNLILDHPNENIREYSMLNANLTPANISKAINDPSVKVRKRLASNNSLNSDHLMQLLVDKDWDVGYTAQKNPNITKEHISFAATHIDPEIRSRIASNSHLNKEQYLKLKNDENSFVRRMADMNPSKSFILKS